jgi:hypothetical protein
MKKLLIGLASLLMVIAFSTNTSAQESFGNAGLEIALPVGDWAEDTYGIGIGGSGGYELGISDNFAVNANVGIVFLSINISVSDVIKGSFLVPIQVGGRYYFDQSRSGFFAEAKVGLHLFSTSTEDVDLGPIGTIEGESNTESYFSAAPQIGYFLNENISLALRYQLFFIPEDADVGQESDTGSFIGLKAAYNF